MPQKHTELDGLIFSGFRQIIRRGVLIFAIIISVLIIMILYQHQRSAEVIRSVEHTRSVIAYIDTLRTYLLNLDAAVREFAESRNPAVLDPRLMCHESPCPNAQRLIELVRTDGVNVERLAPLPALQSALETGFAAVRQRREVHSETTPAESGLAGFDKSAIERIHRILIDIERDELSQLDMRERARSQDQTVSSALLGMTGLWMGLALVELYRKTILLIRAGVDAEQTIRQQSLRDPLTGLGNRRFLRENEKHLIAAAKRLPMQMAVLAVDLDDFKLVNDRYGHAAGDEVLVASAERMKQLVRESDVVVRYGGDEFVIVLEQVESAAAAREVASRVVESLSQPVPLPDGGTARVGASVGIALCCTSGQTMDALLKEADAALYAAKREGKGTYRETGTVRSGS